jgi:hypothetical protein
VNCIYVLEWIFAISVLILATATGVTFYFYIHETVKNDDFHNISEHMNSWFLFGCKFLDFIVIIVFAYSIIRIWRFLSK